MRQNQMYAQPGMMNEQMTPMNMAGTQDQQMNSMSFMQQPTQMAGGHFAAMPTSQPYYHFEPYVYQTLQSVVGRVLVVQTVRDTTRGKLLDVKPDHVVMQVGDEMFFVRIQHIVAIMPD